MPNKWYKEQQKKKEQQKEQPEPATSVPFQRPPDPEPLERGVLRGYPNSVRLPGGRIELHYK